VSKRYWSAAGVVAVGFLAILISACGGSSSHTTATTTTVSASAATQVKENWTTFFSGSTPAATRIGLLQNGSTFASYIQGESSSSLAKTVSVTVSNVVVSGDTATVTYTLNLAGKPVLPNQTGTAVLEDGTWKVGDSSFCALLTLEGSPPAACSK
jgi:hypothetical protein